jgi:serralysin
MAAALDIAARPLNEEVIAGNQEPTPPEGAAPAEAAEADENEGEEAIEAPAAEDAEENAEGEEAAADEGVAEKPVADGTEEPVAPDEQGLEPVEPNTPTEGDDTLEGTDGRDNIDGGAGDDDISGGKGRDTLSGGEGDDDIQGGDGRDVLSGGEGDDNIDGGNGRDTISGGDGQDQLTGGQGADTFVFEEGSSTEAAPDLITDFEQGLDKLDMNELLGANGLSVEQLDFTGGSEGQAGNITQGYDAQSGLTTFQIDLGGDSSFSLQLDGDVTLGQQDFSLAA